MDHDDIVALINAGDLAAAVALIEQRERRGAISGEDGQTLAKLLAAAIPPAPPAPTEEPRVAPVAKKKAPPKPRKAATKKQR